MRRAAKVLDQHTTKTASAAPTERLPAAAQLHANQSSSLSERATELRVSAHTMTLESGLFCIFQTADSPKPAPETGLPGVRITPAPGVTGRPEAVSVNTFEKDGWLNGTAALVRVASQGAQILITTYQDTRQRQDVAPRLQVLRLSDSPNTKAPIVPTVVRSASPTPAISANPEVVAHIETRGDVGGSIGEWIGNRGSHLCIEGFGLAPSNGIALEDIEYQAVLGRDWLSPWTEAGKYCGSRGMALPLLGFKVRLKGNAVKMFDCSYSATFVDGSAVGPIRDGKACIADSLASMESLQIVIHPRAAETAPKGTIVGAAPAPVARVKSSSASKKAAKKVPLSKPLLKKRGRG